MVPRDENYTAVQVDKVNLAAPSNKVLNVSFYSTGTTTCSPFMLNTHTHTRTLFVVECGGLVQEWGCTIYLFSINITMCPCATVTWQNTRRQVSQINSNASRCNFFCCLLRNEILRSPSHRLNIYFNIVRNGRFHVTATATHTSICNAY